MLVEIFLFVLVFAALFSTKNNTQNTQNFVIAIGPHHILASDLIVKVFDDLKAERFDFDEVIIVGPNHFDQGLSDLLTTNPDNPFFQEYNLSNLVFDFQNENIAQSTSEAFVNEHSIYTYLNLVKKNLLNSKITPLIFKSSFPKEKISQLSDFIISKTQNKKTLVLFSVDFSHYQSKVVSELHDVKNLGVLQALDFEESYDMEVDCEACIALLTDLAIKKNLKPYNLINKRSYDYLGKESPEGQTTYIEGLFTAKGQELEKRPITIFAFGDVILGRYVKDVINKYGQDEIFSKIVGLEERFFQGMDFVFANLEGPVTAFKADTKKEIAFRFDPVDLNILKDAGFDIVSIANNHSFDMGNIGFEETKQNLDKFGIAYAGNPKEVSESSYKEFEKSGYKIAFAAFNDTDFKLDYLKAFDLIKTLKSRNDFVIVSIHWGNEYTNMPSELQKENARGFVNVGADAIIGHHPHVLQGMEYIDGKPVFYSLGNFVFDQLDQKETQQTIGVGLSLSEENIKVFLIPIKSAHSRPYEVHGDEATELLNYFHALSSEL